MRLLPAATNGRCGITGGGARIALAVAAVLRPRAFDQQAFCGFIDAEAPRNRRHAPHEIRAAAVRFRFLTGSLVGQISMFQIVFDSSQRMIFMAGENWN